MTQLTYCVKERKMTETSNEKMVKTKNGRNMIKGICASCGSKKCQFVSASTGGEYVIKELPKAVLRRR